jgi:hypothetical protein
MAGPPDPGLEFLLVFNGRIHHPERGYWLKFEIARVERTPERPHGLSYSFTLHAPNGTRLVGFDNAHDVQPKGSRFKRRAKVADHWHRTERDPGRPYARDDFFNEVERVLKERGISPRVISDEASEKPK